MNKIEKLKKQLIEIKAKKQVVLEEIKFWKEIGEYLHNRLEWIKIEEKKLKTLIKDYD